MWIPVDSTVPSVRELLRTGRDVVMPSVRELDGYGAIFWGKMGTDGKNGCRPRRAIPGGHPPITIDPSVRNKTYMSNGMITLAIMQDPWTPAPCVPWFPNPYLRAIYTVWIWGSCGDEAMKFRMASGEWWVGSGKWWVVRCAWRLANDKWAIIYESICWLSMKVTPGIFEPIRPEWTGPKQSMLVQSMSRKIGDWSEPGQKFLGLDWTGLARTRSGLLNCWTAGIIDRCRQSQSVHRSRATSSSNKYSWYCPLGQLSSWEAY